ncbi:PAS domain S-box protein [Mucilaginibacter sp. BT774]|uniref:PAS domain S-box protein n=1 Tax=Mucilaginibacter sp. BT774 TaxID=3062276 RepID=UPI002674EE03|nr:PAS domain S-box protein [Mucilaginibacter sp. BT774]MDO3627946.1 PAS domain S-box protein [Mucilaginibacter sp. BT774]
MAILGKNKTITIISCIAIATGIVVILGWILNILILKRIIPGFVNMVFNTALSFVLLGGALLTTQYPQRKYRNILYLFLSFAGTLIGLVTLLQFIFHFNAGIDELFVKDTEKVSSSHLFLGRMAVNSAICITIFGSGLLMLALRKRAFDLAAQWLFHTVTIFSAIALVGYFYGVSLFSSILYISSMATHTAILFFVLSIAASLLNPGMGITWLFTGKLIGNQMAKRLFTLMFTMIIIFGSIRVQTDQYKLFSLEIWISLLAVCFLLVSLVVIWNTAIWLNRIDASRSEAEAEVKQMNAELEKRVEERSAEYQKSEEKYRSLIEHASDAIYVLDSDGCFTDVNASMCKMMGYTRNELLQLKVEAIVDPEELKIDPLPKSMKGAEYSEFRERRFMRKSGDVFPVEINVKRFMDDRVLVMARDITYRKDIETELRSSEQQYKLLFESNPLPLWMVDKATMRVIAANDAAADQYGYAKDELPNMEVTAFRVPEDRGLQMREWGKNMNIGTERNIVRHVKKNGTVMFIQVVANDIVFEGRAVRLSLTNDVTERLKAEDSLRKSEANLQTILSTTDTAYASFDTNFRLLAYNPTAFDFIREQYRHIPKEGDYLGDFIPAYRWTKVVDLAKQVTEGRHINYEVDYPQDDGTLRWYDVKLSPLTDGSDRISGMLVALYDITERKNAEQNLQTAYERIQDHIDSIKGMAWKQSHLIRSPLANLKALSEMLKGQPMDTELLKHFQTELNRLDDIIHEMAREAAGHDIEN